MSNVVISLAIIGKNNEPLYIKEFVESNGRRRDLLDENELFGIATTTTSSSTNNDNDEEDATEGIAEDSSDSDYSGIVQQKSYRLARVSLKQEFILHSALDRFEQLSGPPPGYAWRKTTANDTNPMYVGLLYPVEDYRVFGWVTTTRIKFFVVVTDDPNHSTFGTSQFLSSNSASSGMNHGMPQGGPSLRPQSPLSPRSSRGKHNHNHREMELHLDTDVAIQKLFESLHQCYVSYVLNPFSPLIMSSASKISSKRFDEYIQAAVTKHNQLCYGESAF